MTFDDEYIERMAEDTGHSAEDCRELLERMAEEGLVEVGSDGSPVPTGPLAEIAALLAAEVTRFQLEMERPWQVRLDDAAEIKFAPGVEPVAGLLRVPRSQADPRLN